MMMFHKDDLQFGWVYRPDIDPKTTQDEILKMTNQYLIKIVRNDIKPYDDFFYKKALSLLN